MEKKLLIAFDFDHTIVHDNTDRVVQELLPGLLPTHVKELRSDWTTYMGSIFKLLHERGVSREAILQSIQEIPATTGMTELLLFLKHPNFEVIIISDSNAVFIESWLSKMQLLDVFGKIYTNPASFNESSLLKITKYHLQDWCNLCSKNLCKGYILQSHINDRLAEGAEYTKIVYVGDGLNDFCPSKYLSESDLVFVRLGYRLEKVLKSEKRTAVKAKIHYWSSADEIQPIIKTFMK